MKAKDPLEPTAIQEAFAKILQEIRREQGLSQEQLGFESGLHRTYISLLERGKKNPTLITLMRLAMALGASPSEIIRRVESRTGYTVGDPIPSEEDNENRPS